jgi:indolepyruvate ferredoxin oxidoreductase, alpha subunit
MANLRVELVLKDILSGNEAIARGAWEAGVTIATGYPGTPSTEILETLVNYKPDVYCEWAPNEKVALEVGAGASYAGARCIVTMKHVGLNVAADPLMTFAYTGAVGGLVIVVADDPGMHSSQNEQDSRHYARMAKVPLLEPSDSQEAKDFLTRGLEISEKFRTPVMLRTNTRVSHSRSIVELGERRIPEREMNFQKDPVRFVTIPMWSRIMRQKMDDRLQGLKNEAESSPLNRIEWKDKSFGIITGSISYQYVRDVFSDASILKLGWLYPFPDKLFCEFSQSIKRILIVEELDDFIEQHVLSLGIKCEGKKYVSSIGELSPTALMSVKAKIFGGKFSEDKPVPQAENLPSRPPVLCPSCPHRGIFAALGKLDVIVTGDIGCYSLGTLPPLSKLDTILCMGAGISMAHGMQKAGNRRRVVGIVGDSTFFHSGITALLDIAYNRGTSTIIVVDNRTTAMTGHQEHPGTGKTLMGEATHEASIEEIARACGVRRVTTINPYDMANTIRVLKEEINAAEPSLIVSKAECPLHTKKRIGARRRIDPEKCTMCRACLKLGCPAIEMKNDKIQINEFVCWGCSLCQQTCKFGAISEAEK